MLEKIKTLVKEYANSYNTITAEFERKKKYINDNYVKDGAEWADKFKEIKDIYNDDIAAVKQSATEDIETIFSNIISKLRNKITEGVSTEVVAELELLKTTKVTEEDIKAYLEKYYNNYLVCKVLKELAEERKIEVEVLTLKDQLTEMEELKSLVIEFFNTYKGPLKSYKAELILNGAIIDRVGEQLNSFIRRYNIDELRM